MDDDKRLLELAAKAAELDVEFMPLSGANIVSGPRQGLWRPLTDDGDALRLAVKLNIGIRAHSTTHWQNPSVSVAIYDYGEIAGRVRVEHGADPSRATRRAIVRAAAAIGEAML